VSLRPRPAVLVLSLLLLPVPEALLGQAPPDTDVYLASLEREGGAWSLGELENLTARPGYDNQPAFTPDGGAILYTVVDDDDRADVWRYDLSRGEAAPVTRTPESEYSPTPIPGSDRFSAVRVEADSTQRLWSFDPDGSDPRLVLPDLRPVGYHAWAGGGTLALYVLGEPSTLQVAAPGPGDARVAAREVGRSLGRIPGTDAVSFVALGDEDAGDRAWITRLDPTTGETRRIAPALEGSVDHAWTPDGTLLMGRGSVLYRREPGESGGWRPVADLADRGLASITRLAVSPDGEKIALVAEAKDP
jgi:hypothetical protein